MKIYGIGTDIVNTIRIKQLLNKKKKSLKIEYLLILK